MAYFAIKVKRVTFAHDDADLLMKPKPDVIAEYTVGCAGIDWIKTAAQLEAEVQASFQTLKISKNAWRPRRSRSVIIDPPLSDEEDLSKAIAELEELSTIMMV
jgi:hypothetical protein